MFVVQAPLKFKNEIMLLFNCAFNNAFLTENIPINHILREEFYNISLKMYEIYST